MSLSFYGFLMIVLVLAAILSKKISPIVSMIVIPAVIVVIMGNGAELDTYITNGVKSVAGTAVMFIFAILFFNMMILSGAFDPIVKTAVRLAGNSPTKIYIATLIVAMIGHLDGSGATTFIITVSAMRPVYQRMKMSMMHLILLTSFGAGIMNIIPWGGPTLRVMTVFDAGVREVFVPMIIPMAAGFLALFALSFFWGKRAKGAAADPGAGTEAQNGADADARFRRPKMVPVNLVLIIVVVVVMLTGILSPTSTMAFAFVLAVILNYPKREDQDELIKRFAPIVLPLTSLTFAAGIFTGILNGAGMLTAMAETIAALIPTQASGFVAVIVGFLGVPLSMLFSPDAYYYGILPTLASAFAQFGLDPIAIGQLSLLGGQMTLGSTMTPLIASSFLLPSLVDIDFAAYQKKAVPMACALGIFMVLVAVVTGCVKVF